MKGSFLYVSHYRRGLVVFDVSDPEHLREVASFDTFLAPAGNTRAPMAPGASIRFFPSGTVVISDISNGLFVLRDHAATLAQHAGQIGFAGQRGARRENVGLREWSCGEMAARRRRQHRLRDERRNRRAGGDYTATTGTLDWAAGDMGDRTISIPIANDARTRLTRLST